VPTYERLPRFDRDWEALSREQRAKFLSAIRKFVEDLEADRNFRSGLRVRGVEGADGVFEMTWDGDGRATFEYGTQVRDNTTHIVWRRIGTHDIFGRP
jgi:hypothetical protein